MFELFLIAAPQSSPPPVIVQAAPSGIVVQNAWGYEQPSGSLEASIFLRNHTEASDTLLSVTGPDGEAYRVVEISTFNCDRREINPADRPMEIRPLSSLRGLSGQDHVAIEVEAPQAGEGFGREGRMAILTFAQAGEIRVLIRPAGPPQIVRRDPSSRPACRAA